MNHDEYQKERMRVFSVGARMGAGHANEVLAEFDKRFPPPPSESQSTIAPAPASPSEPKVQAAVEPEPDMGQSELDYELERSAKDWQDIRDADERRELAALREKARLYDKLCSELGPLKKKAEFWDAVASGKVRLRNQFDDTWTADYGPYLTARYLTAAEAIQAAIDAGALK